EYIITDLQGPYAQTKNGEKYLQIFIDVKSRKVWVAKLKNKTDSDKAIESVVRESYIRSRNKLRVLRTDGDGIFGRSKSFQELREREKFIHERPAPYDHKQSALIDRECRTLSEGIGTALDQSGAPSSFWGDAAEHFTFTRNITPRIETSEGKYKSPDDILENREIRFNLKHLVAFGTQATCFIPPERRERKTPGQAKSYQAVIIGYIKDMQGYLVWDLKEKKKREVSFFHTVVHEGFFPFRERKEEREKDPHTFTPTYEDILTPHEFMKFRFTEEEERDLIATHFGSWGGAGKERERERSEKQNEESAGAKTVGAQRKGPKVSEEEEENKYEDVGNVGAEKVNERKTQRSRTRAERREKDRNKCRCSDAE